MKFDLKKATIYIEDGYTDAAAVNNASGYLGSASTMTIDGIDGEVAVGTRFSVVGGAEPYYTVTAHSEDIGGDTTSITFTPVLGDAVSDNAVITFLPHRIRVKLGEGDLTCEEKTTIEYTRDGGRLSEVREGDEQPLEVNMTANWEFITSDTTETPTLREALKRKGQCSTWVSASPDKCQPYSVNLVLEYDPDCEPTKTEKITFPEFRVESLQFSAKEGNLAIKGTCNTNEFLSERI